MEKIIKRFLSGITVFAIMAGMTVNTVAASDNKEVNIVDMHEIAGQEWEKVESITDSYGESYNSNILQFDSSNDGYISYDLNGNYKSFKGSVVCSEDTGSGALLNIGFFADGELVYSASDITTQQDAQDIDIDLTGIGTLEIKTSNTGEYSCGWLYLVNSTFEKADNTEPCAEWAKLNDMVEIDSRNYEKRIGLEKDVMGDLHNGAITLITGQDAYVLYNLKSQYTTLKGTIIASPECTSDTDIDVNIFADDREVFSKSGITKQDAGTDFEIDVTGVKVLKITGSSNLLGSYLLVVDDILS